MLLYIYPGNGHDLVSKNKQILIMGHCVRDCSGKSLALFCSLDVFWHNWYVLHVLEIG